MPAVVEYTSLNAEYAGLRARLDTMPVIEQAKGIVMARARCGSEEAFELLRRASQRANLKVHVLADRLVEQVSGGPGGRRRPASPAGRSDRS